MKCIANTVTIWILAFIVLGQSICNGLTIIHFKLNQRYIAENLCENRDKPNLHCNGHCQLRKNLKKSEHKDTQIPKQIKVDVLICETSAGAQPRYEHVVTGKNEYPPQQNRLIDNLLSEILKPPTIGKA